MNTPPILAIVNSYMEFTDLRNRMTRNWDKVSASANYRTAEDVFKLLERERMGTYMDGSEIQYPEFISTMAYFSVSYPLMITGHMRSIRLNPNNISPDLARAKDIAVSRGLGMDVFFHEGWNKPHAIIIL